MGEGSVVVSACAEPEEADELEMAELAMDVDTACRGEERKHTHVHTNDLGGM